MTELVTIDIGGTNARFAIAKTAKDGSIELGEPLTLPTDEFPGLVAAWVEFGRRRRVPLPNAAAIAIAGPVTGGIVRMTNNRWVIEISRLPALLEIERQTVINDFAAVAHAAARVPGGQCIHLAGPDIPLPDRGTISVIGPGTGLGVAHFHRFDGGYHVQATEGGHIGFAPADATDDAILALLRNRHSRVSLERAVSGPGIVWIYAALAGLDHRDVDDLDDLDLWQRGLTGRDELIRAAVTRFCTMLGRAAGDYALAHGASAVVIAGGVGLRLRNALLASGFAEAFRDKGRYREMMGGIPVKLLTHPQPGLFGAAAAFAAEHGG